MTNITRHLEVVSDEDQSTLLKVAFATSDRMYVDQHFGSAKSFVIYGMNQDRYVVLNACEFGDLAQDGNEDKLIQKLEVLEGCIAVYCRACGASAVKQLLSIGIQPVKVPEGAEVELLLAALQQELKEGPSSWLAKAVAKNKPDASRFDAMEIEGWEE